MRLDGLEVTVVGGGVGGLAAALALRGRGAAVTLLEQAPEIAEVGAGLQISPNGFAVLDALGLAAEAQGRGLAAQGVSLRRHQDGREVMRMDLVRHAPGRRYLFLHRADLIDLLAAAARDSGVRIRLLQKVTGIEDGPRPVAVTAQDARFEADLVVGADGLRSGLRPLLNGAAPPRFTGQVAWRALVPGPADYPAEARVFMGPGRHLVTYPLRGGALINLVAVEERRTWTDEGWHHRDDPEALRAAFAGFGGPVPDLMGAVEEVHLWGLFRHPVARRWHGTATALIGDAAHPTLPFLAQGANLALEDAWVLGDALARSGALAEGLATYQRRRRDRAQRVIAAASRNAWKYHFRPGPLRALGHGALGLAGRLAPGAVVSSFDWLYGHDVTTAG
jgi:salicylate hydroxylase